MKFTLLIFLICNTQFLMSFEKNISIPLENQISEEIKYLSNFSFLSTEGATFKIGFFISLSVQDSKKGVICFSEKSLEVAKRLEHKGLIIGLQDCLEIINSSTQEKLDNGLIKLTIPETVNLDKIFKNNYHRNRSQSDLEDDPFADNIGKTDILSIGIFLTKKGRSLKKKLILLMLDEKNKLPSK
ncbi:MAG: hypothetical protein NE327_19210 [Lentisphaeraceae bacterium]|nr:hypothetical protein [Lentisphaeraceae bacterium]